MHRVKDNKLDGLRDMFHKADNGKDYQLDNYKACYARYFGCGNHLYILVNECNENKVVEIGSLNGIHPREMAKQLSVYIDDFRIVMVDVEMGGMGVWQPVLS